MAAPETKDLYLSPCVLNEQDFHDFSTLIYKVCGIKMPPAKKTMLAGRLAKRLRVLGMRSYREYFDYVTSPAQQSLELREMVDVVTTNKTDFFRELNHFDYLQAKILPSYNKNISWKRTASFKAWSAGCATGEEPYTLAIILNEFADHHRGFQFDILATDICVTVLKKAYMGIYDEEQIDPVPVNLRRKYFFRSKDREKREVRVCPKLRQQIRFRRINLLEDDPGWGEPMDIIFCCNVIIYFDRPTQYRVLCKLCEHLSTGGILFLGHSETVSGFDLPLEMVESTIYKKI